MTDLPHLPGFAARARLGAGAFGEVFLAQESDGLRRPVAVKVFNDPHAYARELEMARQVEEVRRREGVTHLVQSLGTGEHEGAGWIALEYMEGGSLHDQVAREGALDEAAAIACARQAGRALAALHAAGLLHRDVKPANLLVGRDGQVRLGDFGLTRDADGSLSAAGSAAFAAPEVLAGQVVDGVRADVYSLGATLAYLLTGETIRPGRVDLFALERCGVSRTVQRVVVEATAYEPSERPPDVEAVLSLLDAPVVPVASPAPSPAARRPRLAGYLALGSLASLVGLGVLLARVPGAPSEPATAAAAPAPTTTKARRAAATPTPSAPPTPVAARRWTDRLAVRIVIRDGPDQRRVSASGVIPPDAFWHVEPLPGTRMADLAAALRRTRAPGLRLSKQTLDAADLEALAGLEHLSWIEVEDGRLSLEAVERFQRFRGLETLRLLGPLDRRFLQPIARSGRLKELVLVNRSTATRLRAVDLSLLPAGLEVLRLQNFHFGEALQALSHLARLRRVQLSTSGRVATTSGALTTFLRAGTGLESLWLAGFTRIDRACLSAIARHARLTSLRLGRCPRLTQGDLEPLTRLTGLIELRVRGKRLDDVAFEQVARLQRLEHLSLLAGGATRELRRAGGLQRLRSLHVFYDAVGFPLLRHPGLRRLSLTYAKGGGMAGVADRLPRLEVVEVGGAEQPRAALTALVGLRHLRRVGLAACRFGEGDLAPLARLPSVRELDLSHTRSLPRAGLEYATRVEALELASSDVDDATLTRLARLTQLKRIDLRGCRSVTAAGRAALARALPACRIVPPSD